MFLEVPSLIYHSPITIQWFTYGVLLATYSASALALLTKKLNRSDPTSATSSPRSATASRRQCSRRSVDRSTRPQTHTQTAKRLRARGRPATTFLSRSGSAREWYALMKGPSMFAIVVPSDSPAQPTHSASASFAAARQTSSTREVVQRTGRPGITFLLTRSSIDRMSCLSEISSFIRNLCVPGLCRDCSVSLTSRAARS